MTTEWLERMELWLATNRPDYLERLRPEATEAELDAFEARFSLQLPDSFREFYRWRNGQPPDFSASLSQNWMFSSLDEIAETKELLDGMIGTDFEDPKWWRLSWIPFLANHGGDHLCLDLTAEDGGKPGQLIAFWHDWENRSVKFSNFQSWLQELVESMENGTLELT